MAETLQGFASVQTQPGYKNAPPEIQTQIARDYFNEKVGVQDGYLNAPDDIKTQIRTDFEKQYNTPELYPPGVFEQLGNLGGQAYQGAADFIQNAPGNALNLAQQAGGALVKDAQQGILNDINPASRTNRLTALTTGADMAVRDIGNAVLGAPAAIGNAMAGRQKYQPALQIPDYISSRSKESAQQYPFTAGVGAQLPSAIPLTRGAKALTLASALKESALYGGVNFLATPGSVKERTGGAVLGSTLPLLGYGAERAITAKPRKIEAQRQARVNADNLAVERYEAAQRRSAQRQAQQLAEKRPEMVQQLRERQIANEAARSRMQATEVRMQTRREARTALIEQRKQARARYQEEIKKGQSLNGYAQKNAEATQQIVEAMRQNEVATQQKPHVKSARDSAAYFQALEKARKEVTTARQEITKAGYTLDNGPKSFSGRVTQLETSLERLQTKINSTQNPQRINALSERMGAAAEELDKVYQLREKYQAAFKKQQDIRQGKAVIEPLPEPKPPKAEPLKGKAEMKVVDKVPEPEPAPKYTVKEKPLTPEPLPKPKEPVKPSEDLKGYIEARLEGTGLKYDDLLKDTKTLKTEGKALDNNSRDLSATVKFIQNNEPIKNKPGWVMQPDVDPQSQLVLNQVKGKLSRDKLKLAQTLEAHSGKITEIKYQAEKTGRSKQAADVNLRKKLGESGPVVEAATTEFTFNHFAVTKDGRVNAVGYNQDGHLVTYNLTANINSKTGAASEILSVKPTDKPGFVGEVPNRLLGPKPVSVERLLQRPPRTEEGFLKTSEAIEGFKQFNRLYEKETFKQLPKEIQGILNQARARKRPPGKTELAKLMDALKGDKKALEAVCKILGIGS